MVVPGRATRKESGHDGGHARIEYARGLRARLERHDLVFQDLGVGMGKARIDQIRALALLGCTRPARTENARSASSGLENT